VKEKLSLLGSATAGGLALFTAAGCGGSDFEPSDTNLPTGISENTQTFIPSENLESTPEITVAPTEIITPTPEVIVGVYFAVSLFFKSFGDEEVFP